MKKSLLYSVFVFLCMHTNAQEQKALIIGIDNYTAPQGFNSRSPFPDLNGCVNDAKSVYAVINSRYGFTEKNIRSLYNEQASREKILEALNILKDDCKSGDIAFIYYAGHGSQVYNKKSAEADQRDESIVPADYWKEGVKDIRDKELAAVFNQYLDKGIRLTVIFDCCHSGSMSRGPGDAPAKTRYIAEPSYFVEDDSKPEPPEKRPGNNFLILSAAQDNELAAEQQDDNNIPHGAFTIALLEALQQQNTDAAAINIFTSIRAILKSNGKKQEPVIGGSAERQQQTLFGIRKGLLTDKTMVAVSGVLNNKIEIQGGYAIGIYKETELAKMNGKDTLIKLLIDSVMSVNRSTAKLIKGNISDLHPGDLLEVTNWVSSGAALIRIYLPENNFSHKEVSRIASVANEIRQSGKIKWISNLEKEDPYSSIYFVKNNAFIKSDTARAKIIKTISAAAILPLCKKDSGLYFELPAPAPATAFIRKRFQQNKGFLLVNDPDQANYTIYGMADGNTVSYGFRRMQVSARDSLESMPLQTKAFVLKDSSAAAISAVADSLYQYALRLSKLRGWQQLSGPADAQKFFPYHLEIFNGRTQASTGTGSYKIGDELSLRLIANPDMIAYSGIKKYIYVFSIDKSGNMTLIFPDPSDGNLNNRFPKYDNNNNLINTTSVTLADFTASEPSGTDNFFLLATDDPIPDYDRIFNQLGVQGNNQQRGVADKNPLSDLLDMGNEGSRGVPGKLSRTWSLQKAAFRCYH